MILIKAIPYNLPSYEDLNEFEESFPANIKIKYSIKNKFIKKTVQKILEFYPEFFSYISQDKDIDSVFTILMGASDIYRLLPLSLKAKKVYFYIYDLWEHEHQFFEKALINLNVSAVFLSSLQTRDYLEKKFHNLNTKFYWLPEAIKIDLYKSYPYENKKTDILSFRRRYEKYHQDILEYTKNNNINYIYQENDLIFPTKSDFIEGLANTKISVCFPASITHPQHAGNISKVTVRYLQSMASKCLVLGKSPDDISHLFDYSPIIEIDEKNPCEQLKEILDNFEKYIPLIEKNYLEVTNKHQYLNRVNSVLDILSDTNM